MQVLGHERVGNMEMDKLGKARHARDLARWFREQLRDGTAGEHIDLMAATAMAIWEAELLVDWFCTYEGRSLHK